MFESVEVILRDGGGLCVRFLLCRSVRSVQKREGVRRVNAGSLCYPATFFPCDLTNSLSCPDILIAELVTDAMDTVKE